jgi:hypothetical protein
MRQKRRRTAMIREHEHTGAHGESMAPVTPRVMVFFDYA